MNRTTVSESGWATSRPSATEAHAVHTITAATSEAPEVDNESGSRAAASHPTRTRFSHGSGVRRLTAARTALVTQAYYER